MKKTLLVVMMTVCASSGWAKADDDLRQEIAQLQQQTQALQKQLDKLHKKLISNKSRSSNKPAAKPVNHNSSATSTKKPPVKAQPMPAPNESSTRVVAPEAPGQFHSSHLQVHAPDVHPESLGFYPTALIADNQVITYIAGTPVVSSPYLGDRPSFDGSDYIVNISSINRDIRLMQQRRQLYQAYQSIGYPVPQMPIIALSGKAEPVANIGRSYVGSTTGDLNLGSSELDVAAILNADVEAFMSIAYDDSPPDNNGQRLANSVFSLNQGFVNIGNLEKTPFYFTAGQLLVPFGRYSSAMISSPLTLSVTRTKARPFILGYKSQCDTGPFASVYGFKSDTLLGRSGVGGVNVGYIFKQGKDITGEIGGGYISSINDAQGMQNTGSAPFTTFGGFASITNGSEFVRKIPGVNLHGNISFDRYSLTAEWVSATDEFRVQDLSFDNHGAKPQAAQIEGGMTFMLCDKPASVGLGYQWSKETLALNLPHHRISGVFNISIWKDTVESIEYRHDIDFGRDHYANGAAPPGVINEYTLGTGKSSDNLMFQLGVYF